MFRRVAQTINDATKPKRLQATQLVQGWLRRKRFRGCHFDHGGFRGRWKIGAFSGNLTQQRKKFWLFVLVHFDQSIRIPNVLVVEEHVRHRGGAVCKFYALGGSSPVLAIVRGNDQFRRRGVFACCCVSFVACVSLHFPVLFLLFGQRTIDSIHMCVKHVFDVGTERTVLFHENGDNTHISEKGRLLTVKPGKF